MKAYEVEILTKEYLNAQNYTRDHKRTQNGR